MRIGRIASIIFLCGVLFASGYWTGSKRAALAAGYGALNVDASDALLGAEPLVRDAIRRWSSKAEMPQDEVRRTWSPRGMFIPMRNQGQGMLCVELRLRLGDVGGSPVYCYQSDSTKQNEPVKLVAEYSDVE